MALSRPAGCKRLKKQGRLSEENLPLLLNATTKLVAGAVQRYFLRPCRIGVTNAECRSKCSNLLRRECNAVGARGIRRNTRPAGGSGVINVPVRGRSGETRAGDAHRSG